jgi:hypothetical protein
MGKPMMNPQGEIGEVINDDNGLFRILTVKFKDGHKEELMLANIGPNPERSRKWKWYYNIMNSEPKWVEWGN